MRSAFARLFVLALLVTVPCTAFAWELVRPAISFDRCFFINPRDEERVRRTGNLAGTSKPDEWLPVQGWVEYDFDVPAAGWYVLSVPAELWGMEYFVDGELLGASGGGKISNLWLEKGRHVLRIQRFHWTGFDRKLKEWRLRSSDDKLGETVRLVVQDGRTILRTGETLRLAIRCAGRTRPAKIAVQLIDVATKEVISRCGLELPANTRPLDVSAPLECPREGVFEVRLTNDDVQLDPQEMHPIEVIVVDTTPVARGGELRKTLLAEIDCVTTEPHYSGQEGTKIVAGPAGKYRESGRTGFLFAQHHNRDAGWFAYKLRVPEAQQPYLLETDCPDDAFRTFCIAIREASPDAYPVAGGLDTGGCWLPTNRMQTHSILFWPKTTDLRVVFITAHNDRPGAAVSKIRLYRVEGELPPLRVPASGGRGFVNWYEEGDNYLAVYGAPDRSPRGILTGTDRWMRALSHMGADTIISTVAVYQMSMYPSKYNIDHCASWTFDQVRLQLMKAEKYGLGWIGEFHPECRELEWLADRSRSKSPPPNVMVRKDGYFPKGYGDPPPLFHPLHPVNQEWYIGMIGEFVDRYKDSPAFRGVSLRFMEWANPALNNFHSLDWGYDDLTVGMFEKETGLSTGVRSEDPKRFQARYDWLMTNARERWISWRCQKIAEIHRKISNRVRQARADLKVFVPFFSGESFDALRGAGLDPEQLKAIDGVVLLDCRHGYGRQAYTYHGFLADESMRDVLLEPSSLRLIAGPSGPGAFIFGSRYFEATEVVVPPEALGFPQGTKRTWMSGVVNPAGRHFLERYALALAETDALVLGDGGNAYTLGQPLLREFMLEYRHLPQVPFRQRSDARDPVAVWELSRARDFLFYAVNRERYPVRVSISLSTKGPVKRLSTSEELVLDRGVLRFTLEPYQLLAFQAPERARITGITTEIPDAERAYGRRLVDFLEKLAEDVRLGRSKLDAEGKELLDKTLIEARQCVKEGRLWRLRTMMEHHKLAQKVYNEVLEFPPGLEFLAAPEKARLLKARDLPRPADPILWLELDELRDGTTPVRGRPGFRAVLQGGCELADGRFGRAVRLDGKTGRIVVEGEASSLLDLKSFTISLWANADSTDERRGLVSRQRHPAGYALFLWNGSLAAEVGPASVRTADGLYKSGEWYHIALVFEPGKNLSLYTNGRLVESGPAGQATRCPDTQFFLGWNGWGGRQNDPSPGWFAGRIDELRVFDRALTDDEILAEWAGKR